MSAPPGGFFSENALSRFQRHRRLPSHWPLRLLTGTRHPSQRADRSPRDPSPSPSDSRRPALSLDPPEARAAPRTRSPHTLLFAFSLHIVQSRPLRMDMAYGCALSPGGTRAVGPASAPTASPTPLHPIPVHRPTKAPLPGRSFPASSPPAGDVAPGATASSPAPRTCPALTHRSCSPPASQRCPIRVDPGGGRGCLGGGGGASAVDDSLAVLTAATCTRTEARVPCPWCTCTARARDAVVRTFLSYRRRHNRRVACVVPTLIWVLIGGCNLNAKWPIHAPAPAPTPAPAHASGPRTRVRPRSQPRLHRRWRHRPPFRNRANPLDRHGRRCGGVVDGTVPVCGTAPSTSSRPFPVSFRAVSFRIASLRLLALSNPLVSALDMTVAAVHVGVRQMRPMRATERTTQSWELGTAQGSCDPYTCANQLFDCCRHLVARAAPA